MLKTKLSLLFISSILVLSSCTSVKMASKEVEKDPVYATKADIKKAIRKETVAIERAALETGNAQNQGKKSGNDNAKYDYMPATSYAQRFNRCGNSFFLNDRGNSNFYGHEYNRGMMGMGTGGYAMGGMFNPSVGLSYGYNPWNQRFSDPFMSYYNMRSNSYPFFTYNPYMYSFSLLNNMYDPWMMSNSFYNPYFYNPYYAYNPYGFGNGYCPYTRSYRTASTPNRNYVSQRRNSNIGTNSNNTQSSGRNSNSNNGNGNTGSYGNGNSSNQGNSGFESSGSGSSRGGYNSGSRSQRGSSGSTGSKRR